MATVGGGGGSLHSTLPACRLLLFPLLHACNKGNRRRLHAGNIPLNVTKNNCLSGLPIYPFCRFTIPRTTSQTTWHLSFYREKARVANLIQEVESRLPRENSIALNYDLCLPFLKRKCSHYVK